jgi:hypothetical protein
MTRSVTIVGASLLVALVAGEPRADTATDRTSIEIAARLHHQIQSMVSTGWTVGRWDARIVATRQVVVLALDAPPELKTPPASTRAYQIVLVVGPRMSQAQLDARRRDNQAVTSTIARQERAMESFACDDLDRAYRDDCYRPRTRAEHAMVDKLKALRAKVSELPDYYIDDRRSVIVQVPPTPWNEQLRCDDCDRVKARIVTLLRPYRPASSH